MAWSSAEIDSADLALRATDVPMLIAQAIPISPDVAMWTDVGTTVGTDRTSTATPASRAYDGKAHLPVTTTITDTDWYYVLDVGSAGIEFDCAFILGHNFDSASVTGISLQIADDGAFTTNAQTVGTFSLRGSDKRLGDIELYHTGSTARRYSTVQYIRLVVSKGSAFTPQLGELVLGRSRQLEKMPALPFDDRPLVHRIDSDVSDGGVITSDVKTVRGTELLGNLVLSESAGVSDLRAWYRQVRSTFMWLWEPATNPQDANLMVLNSQMRMPHEGRSSRLLPVDAIEQGPERFYLDVEVN